MLYYIKRRIARSSKWRLSSSKRIRYLRNSYKGKRCFVIGNGPSLRVSDLEEIHRCGDISIASNKIYLAFDQTEWRPTIYTVADFCVAENNACRIVSLDQVKLMPNELKPIFDSTSSDQKGVNIYFSQFVPPPASDEDYQSFFFDDLTKGAFVGETVTNLNIQIAAYLGCSEIYLIGVDGEYEIPDERTPHDKYGEVLLSSGESNHFHPDYRSEGERWSIPRVACHESNYAKCKEHLEIRGIKLANASRKTAIKSLPRVSLDDLLGL